MKRKLEERFYTLITNYSDKGPTAKTAALAEITAITIAYGFIVAVEEPKEFLKFLLRKK